MQTVAVGVQKDCLAKCAFSFDFHVRAIIFFSPSTCTATSPFSTAASLFATFSLLCFASHFIWRTNEIEPVGFYRGETKFGESTCCMQFDCVLVYLFRLLFMQDSFFLPCPRSFHSFMHSNGFVHGQTNVGFIDIFCDLRETRWQRRSSFWILR